MKRTRVYLDGYPWDIRRRNTDWKYVQHAIPRIAEWEPDIDFLLQRSPGVTLRANYKAVRGFLGRRVGMPMDEWTVHTDRLDVRELARSRCDVVFSHREFPLNCDGTPLVWMSAILDPQMTEAYGHQGPRSMAEEFDVKAALFRKATIIQVSTEAEALRHARTFSDIADRFVPVPLFAPHCKAAPEGILEKHHRPSPVRILFVGNQAIRKGLDQLIAAFCSLPKVVQHRATLTVISSFDRGRVNIPANDRISVLEGMPPAQVMEEMSRSHILVNVARFESYGLVFMEAMSQGIACLAPDWEVQREIFDYGNAGSLLECDAAAIRAKLEELIEDDGARYAMGLAAWKRFQERYAPAIVARRHGDMFRSASLTSLLGQ
jgi:glycosyltransferase involved in cell wall biosynthesis